LESHVFKTFQPQFSHSFIVHTGKPEHWPGNSFALEGHTGIVFCVAVTMDGKYITSGSEDMTIYIWDIETDEIISGPFIGHTGWICSIATSPDTKHVASGSDDLTI
jgi:WD40 repeat protein